MSTQSNPTSKSAVEQLRLVLAQLNFLVGDIEGNCQKMIKTIRDAQARKQADCIVFTELALTGYPPEDLLLRPRILERVSKAIGKLVEATDEICIIFGAPYSDGERLYNAAFVAQNGSLVGVYKKQCLPNYNVFDEKRYFKAGRESFLFLLKGICIGVTVCEDIWETAPVRQAVKQGAELILNINASPFHIGKPRAREDVVMQRVAENRVPIIYVNQVGGQDELIFDGRSFCVQANREVVFSAPAYEEGAYVVSYDLNQKSLITDLSKSEPVSEVESAYQALVFAVKEYVNKNGFSGVVIGLSGGIDSALTLAIAVDALGAERVKAVMMPSRYTSTMSLEDARAEAEGLGVDYSEIAIDEVVQSIEKALSPEFREFERDATEENIQARIRGIYLMAISNKTGSMVLSTGNKSEMAVGYATLYGDMAGGFAPLKDVPKTLVYQLAKYRNSVSDVIPERVITREPSAELAPDQKDSDSLPPYEILDAILERFVEEDMSRDELIEQGYNTDVVDRVIQMVFRNEYKRRQAPPGAKITRRAFGRDRRYPITAGTIRYRS